MRLLLSGLLIASTALAQKFPPDRNPQYFPQSIFAEKRDDGDFRARWYSRNLRALREPSLLNLSANAVVYRFTWLRTFHHPICVRITIRDDNAATVVWKVASGQAGYDPGRLVTNSQRDIGGVQLDRIRNLLRQIDLPHQPTELDSDLVGLDGAQWILEASEHGNYTVLDRWSPENGPLRELGLFLCLDVAELRISHPEIY